MKYLSIPMSLILLAVTLNAAAQNRGNRPCNERRGGCQTDTNNDSTVQVDQYNDQEDRRDHREDRRDRNRDAAIGIIGGIVGGVIGSHLQDDDDSGYGDGYGNGPGYNDNGYNSGHGRGPVAQAYVGQNYRGHNILPLRVLLRLDQPTVNSLSRIVVVGQGLRRGATLSLLINGRVVSQQYVAPLSQARVRLPISNFAGHPGRSRGFGRIQTLQLQISGGMYVDKILAR
jgi:hypothetical protein